MDERTLRMLDWEAVVERLAGLARLGEARDLLRRWRPRWSEGEVVSLQAETAEARYLLDAVGEPPLDGVADVRPAAARAARGGVLGPEELLAVAATCLAAVRVRRFLAGATTLPLLRGRVVPLPDLTPLAEEINSAVTAEGRISDGASPALAAARRREREQHARLRRELEALVHDPAWKPFLQEDLYTLRHDRYVLPVRQEYAARLRGVVHGESGSGATVFVEPLSLVEANNELERSRAEVRRCEEAVLRDLSARVGRRAADVAAAVEALVHLDVVLARGRLARALGGVRPELAARPLLDLRRARHPLLGEGAVPVDIRLGEDYNVLIVTGPNTGGKTVTLKTAGLLVLMAQAGLQVPAAEGSRMGVFRHVVADVGDEQAVAQNLSTFSSHMTNIVAGLRRAGPGTLVLLDELGAGTDPAEGAALGRALLEAFQDRGCLVLATTHYSELKTLAYVRPRVRNASVEFDVETLRPTYRLILGVPGRSNAFEIARRLGLEEAVVARARQVARERLRDLEAALAAVEEVRREAERDREQAALVLAEAGRAADQYRRRLRALRERREEALAAAHRRAERLLAEATEEARAAALRARELARAGAAEEAARAAEAARRAVVRGRRLLEAARPEPTAKEGERLSAREVVPGAPVWVVPVGRSGVVEAGPDGRGRVTVRAGSLRLEVPLASLRRVPPAAAGGGGRGGGEEGGAPPPRQAWAGLAREKAAAVSPELHLRRLPVEEALARLDKYLDDALLAGLPRVRIVHGKGTGTLRKAVADFLERHPAVKEFRLAGMGEGGAGVTVVDLRGSP